MKCKVKYTDTAKEDLRSIAVYVAEQASVETAKRLVEKLRNRCLVLEDYPESGALPRDRIMISNGYRFLVCGEYLIFYVYHPEENTAYILAAFNAKRDYMRVMKKYL